MNKKNDKPNPKENNINNTIVKNIIKNTENFPSVRTISGIDLNKTDTFIQKLDDLAKSILKSPENYQKIKEISKKVQKFNQQGNKDLLHFLILLIQDPEINDTIKQCAMNLKEFMQNDYIISSYHNQDFPNAYGLSIILSKLISYKYKDLLISKTTSYDEMLEKIFNQ